MAFDPGDSLFSKALLGQVREQGVRLALRSDDDREEVSFASLSERIARWASALGRALGPPGETVALGTGNSLAFVELFFALRSLGFPVLSVDDTLPAEGLLDICQRMGAGTLIHRRPDGGGETLGDVPDPSVRSLRLPHPVRPPSGTAVIKLTSGSTLRPRGACFTEEALLAGIDQIARGMSLRAGDRVLVAIPLSHSYGFDNGVLSLAALGTPLILHSDVLPASLFQSMSENRVTVFPAVPALLRALARVPWPASLKLRKVISASAPLSPETAAELASRSGLQVHQFFGATECGGISFETRPQEPASHGTVGFPLPGVRLELDEGEGVRVHSAANRFALLPGGPPPPAYVATGDRGLLTPEGRLKLLGRLQPLGNIGGVKIDLGALEAFLRGLPRVEDAAVVPVEDPAHGHRLVAYVETSSHSPRSILELCRARLSSREVPSLIRVVDRLPRTPRGKLDRSALGVQKDGIL
jgi:acyl-CoA synthetase (AMP-forming)/AMP-acid ligase II